ncbi:MAG: universal stress protein [Actinomycetota bacterium]
MKPASFQPVPVGGPETRRALSVLLATDGSEHARKAALFLVHVLSRGQAHVRLLTVLSMELQPETYLGDLSDAPARRALIKERTDSAVGEVQRILEAAGQPTTVSCRFGHPPDEALAEVNEWGPDLVVVGRRGLGRAASLVLGSVSDCLLRHSTAPVLVVP